MSKNNKNIPYWILKKYYKKKQEEQQKNSKYQRPEMTCQELISSEDDCIKEQFEGFIFIPPKYHQHIEKNTFVRYLTNDKKFRMGGLLILNRAPKYFVLKSSFNCFSWSVDLTKNQIYIEHGKRKKTINEEKTALYKLYQAGLLKVDNKTEGSETEGSETEVSETEGSETEGSETEGSETEGSYSESSDDSESEYESESEYGSQSESEIVHLTSHSKQLISSTEPLEHPNIKDISSDNPIQKSELSEKSLKAFEDELRMVLNSTPHSSLSPSTSPSPSTCSTTYSELYSELEYQPHQDKILRSETPMRVDSPFLKKKKAQLSNLANQANQTNQANISNKDKIKDI
tara:strand:+ start:799 stop:1833 length:1035 start_codon:yes stop_codon:yes gene_type:complete